MIDISEKKSLMLSYLKQAGPSLPVKLAKAAKVEPVLASAILSELLGDKRVKMSNMKVGTSSLYLIEGQENMLENFASDLGSGQRSAFERLKKEKVLVDADEQPATRVALRSLRDFAVPFKFNNQIMWRYAFTPRSEVEKVLNGNEQETKLVEPEKTMTKEKVSREEAEEEKLDKQESEEEVEKIEEKESEEETKVEKKEVQVIEKKSSGKDKQKNLENIFDKAESSEAEEVKSEFFVEVMDFLKQKGITFLEEIQSEKKEVVGKVRITSDLGDIDFLLVAKNKKTISKDEISASIQRATYSKMPCFILIRKQPTKAIQKFVEENNLVKIEVMQ